MAEGRRADFAWYISGVWLYFFSGGIQGVLSPWLIAIVLHESSERVGFAQMLSMLPMMLLGLFGGAMADRQELRGHMLRLQLIAMLPPLTLAGLILGGFLTYELMLVYALTLSALGGYIMPARDSMLSRVVASSPRGNLQNAVALAMSGQFLSQVGGLLLGGTAVLIGAPALLLAQSLMLGAAAFTTSRLAPAPPLPRSPARSRRSPLRDVREGLEAVWRSERIRPVLIFSFFAGVLFMGVFLVLFPILVRDTYHGSSFELGLLSMCFFGGVGTSSLLLSRLRPIRRQGRAMMLAMCVGSLVMVLIHMEPPVWALNLLTLCWGLAVGVSMSQSRAIVQEAATDALRARMLAAFQLGSMGGGPIGAFITGFLIKWLGPLDAVLVPAGLMIFLWLAMFLLTPLWRMEAPSHQYTPNA